MQALCAYETVALGYSEFCNLFTEDEWKGYEYGLGEFVDIANPPEAINVYDQTSTSGTVSVLARPPPPLRVSATSKSWSPV